MKLSCSQNWWRDSAFIRTLPMSTYLCMRAVRSTWVDGAVYYADTTSSCYVHTYHKCSGLTCYGITCTITCQTAALYLCMIRSIALSATCVHSTYHTPNKEIVMGRCWIRECKMLHLLMCSWRPRLQTATTILLQTKINRDTHANTQWMTNTQNSLNSVRVTVTKNYLGQRLEQSDGNVSSLTQLHGSLGIHGRLVLFSQRTYKMWGDVLYCSPTKQKAGEWSKPKAGLFSRTVGWNTLPCRRLLQMQSASWVGGHKLEV